MSSTAHAPCAACKCRRQKCTQECIFAPYFPPENPQKFENVHKVFGASNVAKILHDLPPQHRADAANSLDYEAQCRIQDPIYGCVSLIANLQNRFNQVMGDLELAKNELATYMGGGGGGGGGGGPYPQQMPLVGEQDRLRAYLQAQGQQHNNDAMVNFIAADFNQMPRMQQGGETSHQIHPQFYPPENEVRANATLLREQVQLISGEKNEVGSQEQLNPQYYPPHMVKNEVWPHNSLLREQVQPNLQYHPQQMAENELRSHPSSLLREQVQSKSGQNELRQQGLLIKEQVQSKPHHYPH